MEVAGPVVECFGFDGEVCGRGARVMVADIEDGGKVVDGGEADHEGDSAAPVSDAVQFQQTSNVPGDDSPHCGQTTSSGSAVSARPHSGQFVVPL